MEEDEILDAINDNAGYCTTCEAITMDSSVEPDAENYECPDCGNMTVMGIEQAILLGKLPKE